MLIRRNTQPGVQVEEVWNLGQCETPPIHTKSNFDALNLKHPHLMNNWVG